MAHEHVRVIVLTCCVLRFRMADVLGRPEPAAISGNTSYLPPFLVPNITEILEEQSVPTDKFI